MNLVQNNKILIVALVAIALTGCGGSSSKKSSSSVAASTPASDAASSTPASVVASSSGVLSSTPTSVAASSTQASSSFAPVLVVFEDEPLPQWHAWDCCGLQNPPLKTTTDVGHEKVTEFAIFGSTVAGFTARNSAGAVGGMVFDATSIKATGTVSFDLKMTKAPTAGVGVWKFKVESGGGGAGNAAEVNLSTSQEAHAAPELDVWQTYTFRISDLEAAGVNVSAIDLFLIFPAWGTGDGAVFWVDNLKVFDAPGAGSGNIPSSVAASIPSSVPASSAVASSMAASSIAASIEASSTPASVAASSVDASSTPASSAVASSIEASSIPASSSSIASSSSPSAALVVFEELALSQWNPWDCCGGSTPVVITGSEVDHGQVAQFSINGATVVGFSSRADHGAVGGTPFDASSIKTTGTVSFDLKMTQAATAGPAVWKFKVESNGGAGAGNAAEVNLTTSQEGHAAPVLNVWQTYTFNISALEAAGVNVSGLDLFMIFPAWGTGGGAIFQIDNMKINATGAVVAPVNAVLNMDFEEGGSGNAGYTWLMFENSDNPALEFVANPDASGINTSAKVAKFTARQAGQLWAGTETHSAPKFTLDSTNKIVKIMVYKSVISDVALKFSVGAGAQSEKKVANTKINEWEELMFDFSSNIGLAHTVDIDGIIVFPDFGPRTSDNICYFDNVTFNSN